jgi:hypothetical protein
MNDCSKLYCKIDNFSKITLNSIEYFLNVIFRGEQVWIA